MIMPKLDLGICHWTAVYKWDAPVIACLPPAISVKIKEKCPWNAALCADAALAGECEVGGRGGGRGSKVLKGNVQKQLHPHDFTSFSILHHFRVQPRAHS